MRIQIRRLLQLAFRGDVLSLVKIDSPQQAVSARILSILLKNRLGLLASFRVLRRQHQQIAQTQPRFQILRVEIHGVRKRLAGCRGMFLLGLQNPHPVIGLRVIGINLDSLPVLVLRRGEILLREVLLPFFHVLPSPRCTAATRQDREPGRQ